MDEKNVDFYRMKEMVAKRKAENELRFKEQSNQKLRKDITSKMRTNMIGGLAIFEKYFGELWGHNSNRRLTPEEMDLKEVWERTRAEILDKGNSNIRAVEDEVANYNCEWKKFKTDIVINKHTGEKNG